MPLIEILTWSLVKIHSRTEERAEFLAKHSDLATLLKDVSQPKQLTATVDAFFARLLRLDPTETHDYGDFLAMNGHTRVGALTKWLHALKPENAAHSRHYQRALGAWHSIHDAISRLRPYAEKAGFISDLAPRLFPAAQPPRALLTQFTDAYDRLREVHDECQVRIDQYLKDFLAPSVHGLEVSESAHPRLMRWLARALGDVYRERRKSPKGQRRSKRPLVTRMALRVSVAAALVFVCAGLAFVLYPYVLSQPALRQFFDGQSAAGHKKQGERKHDQDVNKTKQRSVRQGKKTNRND